MLNLINIRNTPALLDLNKRALLIVGVTSLALSILQFALPMYSLQIYDRVLTSRSADTLIYLSLLVIGVLCAIAILDAIRARLLLRIGNSYALKLTPIIFELSVARSASRSEPFSHAFRDISVIRSFISSPYGLATLFEAPLVPLFLFTVYLISVPLGHLMLGGLVLLLALTFITEAFTASPLKQSGEAAILAQQDIDGILKNAEIVEALGMRKALQRHWGVFHEQSLGKASQASERATGIGALARFVRMALGLLTTGAGAWYAIHDELTIGAMAATSILASRGMAPVETLIGAWKNLVGTRAAVGRINLFLAAKPPNINGTKLPKPKGNIAIERLVYCPPESSLPTIKGINLFLPAGALLGVIGPSGAGKSTLLKLICGVWQPQSGHVRLDGADVSTWHRQDLGQYCGYLPQDIELFSGTVRDNIARFNNRTEIDDTKIIAAAENAGVHELILGLPHGYDTLNRPGNRGGRSV